MASSITHCVIKVKGIVQGVGVRPCVYHLAHKYNLKGWVNNTSEGVTIDIEGVASDIKNFIHELKTKPPALAAIASVDVEDKLESVNYTGFEIKESKMEPGKFVPVSPDISICGDCLEELFDKSDRRHLYPFINCTNCGPRFTITEDIPYDRKNTTMALFKMCSKCQSEYDNPTDRRFHAQPNACAQCGPSIELWDYRGKVICSDPIAETVKLLKTGKIMAIKGLGGFHLACDAQHPKTITQLRKRKLRTSKPFAVMSFDIKTIKRYCYVSSKEEALLSGPRRPIVLLRKKKRSVVSDWVAPKNNYVGVMLPYTPLHYLLLREFNQDKKSLALVMTSANISEEPICMSNQEAMKRLSTLADFFLLHNRNIHIRCDDAVATVIEDRDVLIRRARGFAPHPVYLDIDSAGILACGAELKNTFCLSKGNAYFMSQHIGDLENLEAYNFYTRTIEHYQRFFRIKPSIIAHDLHPDYLSTKWAREQAEKTGIKLVGIQHYHAHMAACMAEHKLSEKVIGVTFDGTGYGTDGKIWGGEFLVGDYADYQRLGHLRYAPLPGGDTAIKNPYRVTLAYLFSLYGRKCLDMNIPFIVRLLERSELSLDTKVPKDVVQPTIVGSIPLKRNCQTIKRLNHKAADIILRQMEKGVNAPLTSSCGRLFDAVSSLLGVRDSVSYEAQAAIELEMIADEKMKKFYQWGSKEEEGQIIIDTLDIFKAIIHDLNNKVSAPVISAKFHNTVAQFIGETCRRIKEKTGLNKVVLSGGVFQNRRLLLKTLAILRKIGFEVFYHQKIPTNDGGISLGQSVIAASKAKAG
ncbi:carbamoyltransferase HypF [Planctomycetota bacterium]